LHQIADVGRNEHMDLSYSAVKLFSKNSNVYEHGTWSLRTGRQTDESNLI